MRPQYVSRWLNLRSNGSYRNRIIIIIILCVGECGYKAPPLLIFKGKKGSKKELDLQNNVHIQKRRIYVRKMFGMILEFFNTG